MNFVEALIKSGKAKDVRNMRTSKVVIFPEDEDKYVHFIMSYNDLISKDWEPQKGCDGKIVSGEEPDWVELVMAQELFDSAQTIFDICKDHMSKDDINFIQKACPVELSKLKINIGE